MDGMALVGGYLAELDEEINSIALTLVDGRVTDWVQYRQQVARRQALLQARAKMMERLSVEQRRFMGVG